MIDSLKDFQWEEKNGGKGATQKKMFGEDKDLNDIRFRDWKEETIDRRRWQRLINLEIDDH